MQEKTLLEYWLILYQRKRIILIIILSSMLTAAVASYIIPPVYEAKVVFFVPTKTDAVTFLSAPGQSMVKMPLVPATNEDLQSPYIGILKSRAIAELIQRDFPHKTVTDLMRRDRDITLDDEYLIEIYARDRDPKKAAGIANAYYKYFNQVMQDCSQNTTIVNSRKTLLTRIDEIEKELAKARSILDEYQKKNKMASIDEETKQYISMKMSFKNKLDASTVSFNENAGKIAALTDQLKKEGGLLSASDVIVSSPLLESIQKQLTDAEVKMATLRTDVTELHPSFVAVKNEYAELRAQMEKETNRIVKSQIKAPSSLYENLRQQLVGLYLEKETLKAGMDASKAVLKDIDEEMRQLPAMQAKLDNMVMEVERNKKILDALKTNLEEITAQRGKEMLTGVLVDEAVPPKKPSFPVLWLNLILSGLSGIIAGVIYAFFLEYLKETKRKRIFNIVAAIEASENE